MPALLMKGLTMFFTNLMITLVGEAMIQWVFFKVAHWIASKTKTTVDDEFVDKLEQEYKHEGHN
ncbi:hypothetical protein PQC38_gp119 [Aeromonas phage BUCT695]|uniref:hypothetical protein n=1 Tax=Aeromonas phage BUCT695 TaxID=2908630 RepID=UPI0023295D3E|nr:hypothetical protein PQC38_gp119 [Aeromonas phage BUCT695]UIW10595.1 hypothetical protein [Aeromonas phage BUCT695]